MISRRRAPAVMLVVVVVSVALAAGCTGVAAGPSGGAGNAVTVRRAWARTVSGWPSQLAADRHGVVVLSDGHVVTALRRDGSRRWAARIGGEITTFQEPAIDATTVLVSAGDRFVALDRATGAVRWEVPSDGDARAVAVRSGSAATTTAFTATLDGRLTARDPHDGRARWVVAGVGLLDAHLAVAPNPSRVVGVWRTARAATVRAVDASSGRVEWERPLELFAGSPVIGSGMVVVAAGDGDYSARVRALALTDGAERWSTPVPASFEADLVPAIAPPAAGGRARPGAVAVHDHHGTVTLLDPGNGRVRWQTRTGVPALGGQAVLTTAAVVVRNEGRQLVVLDRRTGRIRARRTDPAGLPEAITRLPPVGGRSAGRDGSRIVVAWRWTEPGRVDALEIRDAIRRSGSRP